MDIKCPKNNGEPGFTILELMLVIAVIGILAIVGVPKYQALKTNYYLESSAQTVIAELKYVKQIAMDQRKLTYIVFDNSTVKIVQDHNGLNQVLDAKSFENGVVFDPYHSSNAWLPQIAINGTTLGWGIAYNYRGFPADSGTIHLIHSSGRTVGVNIAEKTGYLSVIWP